MSGRRRRADAVEALSSEINELAKERSRSAAERTLAAWIQNCLLLIGSGLAVDRVIRNLNPTSYSKYPHLAREMAPLVGLGAIALGVVLLFLPTVEYRRKFSLEKDALSTRRDVPLIVISVILFGLFTLALIVLANAYPL